MFKIRSTNRCGSGVEGTGFLYAPHRLMTNAHVVAGVTEPEIKDGDRTLDATVVYYNPDVDVAVLDVPGLDGPTIRFDLDGKEKQQGAVLGYPQDGPYDAQPARIRGEQRLRSPDIYGNGTVTRHVFSLRGRSARATPAARSSPRAGKVLGVVFAASVSDKAHRLRAHRRPGPPGRGQGPAVQRPGVERQLRLGLRSRVARGAGLTGPGGRPTLEADGRSIPLPAPVSPGARGNRRAPQLLRLKAAGICLPCSMARSGGRTCLDLLARR